MNQSNAYLVESIPEGMTFSQEVEGVKYTKDVLTALTNKAQKTIDLTAMYWELFAQPASEGEPGFTEEQLREMGADYGKALFEALANAAKRGVKIRILQSPGFDKSGKKSESAQLAEYDTVEIRQIDMRDWYDGGIMHQKFWVFDNQDIYLGSANMDWKSLTQVKELGIALENQREFAEEATRYFDAWWRIAGMEPETEKVFDRVNGFERKVPAWSRLVPVEKRIPSPIEGDEFRTEYNINNQMPLVLDGEKGNAFITGCPVEFCAPERTYDGDGLAYTIREAKKSVCVSVMDFAPLSLYRGKRNKTTGKMEIEGKTATAAWWPMLFDALLHAAITNGVQVRLLISKWEHTSPVIEPFLRGLKETAAAGRANYETACGSLDIRIFYVPGWNLTSGSNALYPDFTRVNHTKYIVTDKRLNVGTSNMTWDYFTNTAGTSFNSNHRGLVNKGREIFDRDWDSEYAYRF